ncbi:MAG: MGH1-like glycoside hydrolase domain-containing protein [Candidatus Hodarchaeales archaeon]
MIKQTNEYERLIEDRERKAYWRRWGPYLSERQWGTVREDYSENEDAWGFLSHDQARSKAYRWGEDGIGGISDNHQRLCFALSMWNTNDPIIKERLFGLTNSEGNHGEDVKEYYYYLDSTPTHSYMKMLYKYPQQEFPYDQLIQENKNLDKHNSEYELIDTGIFDENRYFNVFIEYAKSTDNDILIQITIQNKGPDRAVLHLLPTLWFRNTWGWEKGHQKPQIVQKKESECYMEIKAIHQSLGTYRLYAEKSLGLETLFTDNETNYKRLYTISNGSTYTKDGINEYLVNGNKQAVNSEKQGTKAAMHYKISIESNETSIIRLRLSEKDQKENPFSEEFKQVLQLRKNEADEFYSSITPTSLEKPMKNIQRQAFAGLLWTKQFYHYIIETWLKGDSKMPVPPASRNSGRNHDWIHFHAEDILSMPDKWEYPWFAAWDTAFHLVPFTIIDPDFAKKQLILLTREWYMHPNGAIPAYEWNFSDVNPPVHAWAAWKIYKTEQKIYGKADKLFLERVFQKLLLNFTWWVNRKDKHGKNIFQGGFLGLDNIGVIDRSGQHLEEDFPLASLDQADGTAWMGMYCLNMLRIALELAQENASYEDIASKFFEHFLYITSALESFGLWNEADGFFYDAVHFPDGSHLPLRVRSLVGLIPLFGVEVIDETIIDNLPDFKRRMQWFMNNRKDLVNNLTCTQNKKKYFFSIVRLDQLKLIIDRLVDENEFLSTFGIRSLSKYHETSPYVFSVSGHDHQVSYEPGESTSNMFGGNSNWRGPIWFPTNYLILESLLKFHSFFEDEIAVERSLNSVKNMNLGQLSQELARRLISIFLPDKDGSRPVYGNNSILQQDSSWNDYILFYEYFHGDSGKGLGASHQTGWTSLVATLIQQYGEYLYLS